MTTLTVSTLGKRLIEKHPGKLPVIVEYDKLVDNNLVEKKVEKYTIDEADTVGILLQYVRKHVLLDSSQAIYLLVNNTSLSAAALMIQVYEKHKNPVDDCLYVSVVKENVFG